MKAFLAALLKDLAPAAAGWLWKRFTSAPAPTPDLPPTRERDDV